MGVGRRPPSALASVLPVTARTGIDAATATAANAKFRMEMISLLPCPPVERREVTLRPRTGFAGPRPRVNRTLLRDGVANDGCGEALCDVPARRAQPVERASTSISSLSFAS